MLSNEQRHCESSVKKIYQSQKFTGFTLVELLVGLIVLAILITAGVPGLTRLFSNVSTRSDGDLLVRSIAFARQTAVSSGRNATICASTNGAACGADASAWNTGWIVFVDANSDATINGGEEVLKAFTLSGNGSQISAGAPTSISFNARGEQVGAAVTMVVCGKSGEEKAAKTIEVGTSGYVDSRTGAVSC